MSETQRQVEETAAAYDEAVKRVEELQTQITENQARINVIEEELPEQKDRGDNALRELYKLDREGANLLDFILSAQDFSDVLSMMEYVSHVRDQHVNTLNQLQQMRDELQSVRENLNAADAEAKIQQQNAADALKAAQEAREKVQKEAQEKARQEALARARIQENLAASQQLANERSTATDQQQSQQPSSQSSPAQNDPQPVITATPTDDNADWTSDKSDFVNKWAERINSYLQGSPLSGYGSVFAEAAWDYGVDPRWSPAISLVESSKGLVCFRSHNAWGWGDVSWGSWEEAIPAHVSGLARGYGYTVTEAAAQKYCPPTWQDWYSKVSAEMNKI